MFLYLIHRCFTLILIMYQDFLQKKGRTAFPSLIQILNTLIDHLSSIKAGKTPAAMKSTSPDEINSLIENYQTQIRQAVAASQNSLYGIAGARPEAGVLFSFDA